MGTDRLDRIVMRGTDDFRPVCPSQFIDNDPDRGQGQSVTYTFYSGPDHQNAVGWWSYGQCGTPYNFGTHTQYFTIVYVNCGGQ